MAGSCDRTQCEETDTKANQGAIVAATTVPAAAVAAAMSIAAAVAVRLGRSRSRAQQGQGDRGRDQTFHGFCPSIARLPWTAAGRQLASLRRNMMPGGWTRS